MQRKYADSYLFKQAFNNTHAFCKLCGEVLVRTGKSRNELRCHLLDKHPIPYKLSQEYLDRRAHEKALKRKGSWYSEIDSSWVVEHTKKYMAAVEKERKKYYAIRNAADKKRKNSKSKDMVPVFMYVNGKADTSGTDNSWMVEKLDSPTDQDVNQATYVQAWVQEAQSKHPTRMNSNAGNVMESSSQDDVWVVDVLEEEQDTVSVEEFDFKGNFSNYEKTADVVEKSSDIQIAHSSNEANVRDEYWGVNGEENEQTQALTNSETCSAENLDDEECRLLEVEDSLIETEGQIEVIEEEEVGNDEISVIDDETDLRFKMFAERVKKLRPDLKSQVTSHIDRIIATIETVKT